MKTKDFVDNYMRMHKKSRASAFRELKKLRASQEYQNQSQVSNNDGKLDTKLILNNDTKIIESLRLELILVKKQNDTLSSKIDKLEALIIAGFGAISKGVSVDTSVETKNDTLDTKKEGGLGGVILSFLESNSLIDIEDSKEKNIKKEKQLDTLDTDTKNTITTISRKKRKDKNALDFVDDGDKQAFEYFCSSYPESARASKPEVCARHWKKLTQQQKQDALDKIPLIQEYFKNTDPQYIDKLSNMIHGRRWEQITERTVELKNAKKGNKVDKDMLREMFNDQMGIY